MLELDRRAHTFTGQGSQRMGMWDDLRQSASAGKIFRIADKIVGFPLSRLCSEGPLEELTQTRNAQPGILVDSLGALRTAQNLHPELMEIRPKFCLGHSVGEYSALVDAGVIDAETAIYLVWQRGLLMEQLSPEGKMTALLGFKDKEEVVEICAQTGAEVANFNGPSQIVISGRTVEVESAQKMAREKGIKFIPLRASHPFHSSLMRPVQDAFREILFQKNTIEFKDPRIPVILNVTAQPCESGAAIKENLVEQIVASVRWEESIKFVLAQEVDVFLEFGPEAILTGLLRRIKPAAGGVCIKDFQSAQALTFNTHVKLGYAGVA
ncbi:MAG: ACP S-malonyltransferase [Patescibacteria group bacterium]|nr:ACP S-malonyltransferase [Patescibacteria group bacterium]